MPLVNKRIDPAVEPAGAEVLCDLCGKPIEDWRIVPATEHQPAREEGWSLCHPQGPVITRAVTTQQSS